MTPRRRFSPIGAHVPVGRDLVRGALGRAAQIGAETIQIFAGNPRGWANPRCDPDADAVFADAAAERGLAVFVHAPYLINFGSPSAATLERSAGALDFSLRRAQSFGAAGVVLHAGSAVLGNDWEAAMQQLRPALLKVLDNALRPGGTTRLLIEPTAGGGGALASDLDSLGRYLDVLGRDERIGVCLDTCHLHAAGHDLSGPKSMAAVLRRAGKVAGSGGIGLLHVNDSRDPAGSKRDRHAAVGSGTIGRDAFAALFTTPAVRGVPMIVETAEDDHPADIRTLKQFRAAVAGA